jgi:hypothetical protein
VITWGKYVTRAIQWKAAWRSSQRLNTTAIWEQVNQLAATLQLFDCNKRVLHTEYCSLSTFLTFVCLEGDTPSVHGIDDATFYLFANHFLPAKR